MYSLGVSEEVLGRALRDFAAREQVVIATKGSIPMGDGPNERGLSRKHIMDAIDDSLRRLGTDYVDLYQIHRFDARRRSRRRCGARRHRQGGQGALHRRVEYVRVAAGEGSTSPIAIGWTRFVSMQNHYNLVYREEEREMIPLCREEGHRRYPMEPARARVPRRKPAARKTAARPPARRATSSRISCTMPTTTSWSPTASRRSPDARSKAAQVALAWLLAPARRDRAHRRRVEDVSPRRGGGVAENPAVARGHQAPRGALQAASGARALRRT